MNFVDALKNREEPLESHIRGRSRRSHIRGQRQTDDGVGTNQIPTNTDSDSEPKRECYRSMFITHEDTGLGIPMNKEKWCQEYSTDIDCHFRTLIKMIKKHFPKNKINIVQVYKNFKNLCYESSSIKDDFDFVLS